MQLKRLFTTAYWPPVSQLMAMLEASSVMLDGAEYFQKQSYRNRMEIVSPNGVHPLSIPVRNDTAKMPIQDVRIDYASPWQRNHWRSMEAAYNNSPFFLYYKDLFHDFYFSRKHEYLFEYNLGILELLFKIFAPAPRWETTQAYHIQAEEGWEDCRRAFHPKRQTPRAFADRLKPYPQVFNHKFGFIPDLSIMDLLCNLGPESLRYLQGK